MPARLRRRTFVRSECVGLPAGLRTNKLYLCIAKLYLAIIRAGATQYPTVWALVHCLMRTKRFAGEHALPISSQQHRTVLTRRQVVLAALASRPLLAIAGVLGPALPARAAGAEYGVTTAEPVWIEMPDGVKLAARLWLPKGAPGERFPCVFEYIPYRTHDSYRLIDDHWGPQLAAAGIAFARVDIRGSGNSEGLLADEYLASEQADGATIIAWLARQSWCNGNIGMRGISWGGFSALQVAALAPPALKAIMPMCATDMRFRNDAHYVGGAPGLTNLKWAAGFSLVMSGPPDPAVVGPRWDAMWRQRLENTPGIAARWMQHQHNDAYWRHASVGIDPAAIRCAVYLVDGWADSYAESAERLLRGITAPKKAIIGPWGHIYPDLGRPGPSLAWASEERRWWRHWLAGEDNGVMDGPTLRFFMPYKTPSETAMADLPGRWCASPSWPDPHVHDQKHYLAPGRMQSRPPAPSRLRLTGDKVVGLAKPEWIPFAASELPQDQRHDDARSMVFDGPMLHQDCEILGIPRLHVRLTSDRPVAQLAARLCEVRPDGTSLLITTGLINLPYRRGFNVEPQALVPGEAFDLTLDLAVIAHRFRAGSVIRLALSQGLWPLVWPSPQRATLDLELGQASLSLPVRAISHDDPPLPIAETHDGFSRGEPSLVIEPQDAEGWVRVHGGWPDQPFTVPGIGTRLSGHGPDMDLTIRAGDPTTSRWTISQASRFQRDAWDCETRIEIRMTCDASHYHVEERLTALQNGQEVFRRELANVIPRLLT